MPPPYKSVVLFYVLFSPLTIYPAKYNALVMTGGYASWERFAEPFSGATSNDRAALSQRFRLNATDVMVDRLQWSFDLRDKHDFFDKLNRELSQLEGENTFQVQQASAHYQTPGRSIIIGIGRFPIRQYGGEFLDGAEVKSKLIAGLSGGLFAGLNPKRQVQYHVGFNKDSYQFGAMADFSEIFGSLDHRLYMNHAFHVQRELQATSRAFFFQDAEYQWSETDRIRTMLYLDFVPNLSVQNGNLLFSKGWSPELSMSLHYMLIDSIRYLRIADLLEQLPSSAYQEGKMSVRYRVSNSLSFSSWALYGKRQSDQLDRIEAGIGTFHPKFLTNRLSLESGIGYRRPFSGNDVFARGRIQYVSRQMELGFLQEVSAEQRPNSGNSLPTITDLSGTYYFPDSLFLSLSLQYARNSLLNIYSGFLQAGYRFGNASLASIRETVPTRNFW